MSKNTKTTAKAPVKAASKPKVEEAEKKEEDKPSVLPNEVLAAINEARKANPKDKHGDGAFRVNVERIRKYQNATDKKKKANYVPFEVNHRGKWIGLNIRVMNVKTTAGIKALAERKYGVDLQFRRSSTFTTKDRRTGEDITQQYGEAVFAAFEAWQRLTKAKIDAEELDGSVGEMTAKFQYGLEAGDKLEDPIMRVALKTNQDNTEFTQLKDDIRDVRRRLKKVPVGEVLPYDLALDGPEDDEDSKPLTPYTVHTFFKPGTPVFGIHCMDQFSEAKKVFNLNSSYSLLAAKKPKGARPQFSSHFDADEMNAWEDAEAYVEDAEEGAPADGDAEGDDAAAAEEGDGYDNELVDAVADNASDGEAAAEEVNDELLDALEEKVTTKAPVVPEPVAAPAKKTPAKKAGKK